MKKITNLKSLNHYLLTNYPLVWRTKVHYFLIFGLIGNLIAILIPTLAIATFNAFPTENAIYGFQFLGLIFCAFLLLFWGFNQSKFPISPPNLKSYMITGGLYALCVLSVGSVFFTSTHTTVHQLAIKDTEGKGKEYQAFLTKHSILSNSYNYSSYSAVLTKDELREAEQILNFYQASYHVKEKTVEVVTPYSLKQRVRLFEEAQLYTFSERKNNRDEFTLLLSFMLLLLLMATLIVPAALLIWSNIGFLLTVITTGIQFLIGTLLVGFSVLSGFDSESLPILYLMTIVVSIFCIAIITKPGKLARFMAWSTIPFSPLFIIMFVIMGLLIPSGFEISLLALFLYTLLFTGLGVVMTAAFCYLAANKLELPKAS